MQIFLAVLLESAGTDIPTLVSAIASSIRGSLRKLEGHVLET